MKFEYNGNLLEEDRINLVVREIIDKYPQISVEKAKDAAIMLLFVLFLITYLRGKWNPLEE